MRASKEWSKSVLTLAVVSCHDGSVRYVGNFRNDFDRDRVTTKNTTVQTAEEFHRVNWVNLEVVFKYYFPPALLCPSL